MTDKQMSDGTKWVAMNRIAEIKTEYPSEVK